nr:FMN-binding negative transcriptional regulator [Acinetobacter junii]
MYLPEIFEEKNTEKLYQLVEKYPLGTLGCVDTFSLKK